MKTTRLMAAATIVAASLATSLPALAQQTTSTDCSAGIVGRWYGTDVLSGGRFLLEQKAGGDFELSVKLPNALNHMKGRWSCANGLFSSWTQTFNGGTIDPKAFGRNADVSEFRSLDADHWTIRDVVSGNTFTFQRVAADFVL